MLALHEQNLRIAAEHAIADYLNANPGMKYSRGAVVRAMPLHLKVAAERLTWNITPIGWSVELTSDSFGRTPRWLTAKDRNEGTAP